ILAEVETDKADVEMEAFGAGVLRKILVPAGSSAPIGSLIAVIAEPGEDIGAVVSSAPAVPESSAPPPGPAGPKPGRPTAVPPQPKSEDFAAKQPAPAAAARSEAPGVAIPVAGAAADPSRGAQVAAAAAGSGRVRASPLARKIAAQAGVDLRLLHGSGPGGR